MPALRAGNACPLRSFLNKLVLTSIRCAVPRPIIACTVLGLVITGAACTWALADTTSAGGTSWPSEPPADCPFPRSESLAGIVFTGRHAEYTGADTWYPSWAADGNLYSPWTDGQANGLGSNSGGDDATTGHATILGSDPLNLVITNQGVFKSSPGPYLKNFGEQAYFVNIPSKFIAKDGRSLWLCYAANFSSGWGGITFQSRPPGSRYGLCLQEARLLIPGEVPPRK